MAEIQGKAIAQKILDSLKKRASALRRKPVLSVLMVGDDQVSAKYVAKKVKAAAEVGIECQIHNFPVSVSPSHLIEELIRIQHRSDAVMVQLPLPKQIDQQEVLDEIDSDKDVDCLSSKSLGLVARGDMRLIPPTAGAVLQILADNEVEVSGKHIVVVGQGELVGKPLAAIFLNMPVTLTVCGLGTPKLSDFTKKADILISGTGQANLITADMVKKGAVVIDAGTSLIDGKLSGDVEFDKVSKKAKLTTPVPGGVGPITVAKLLENVIIVAER